MNLKITLNPQAQSPLPAMKKRWTESELLAEINATHHKIKELLVEGRRITNAHDSGIGVVPDFQLEDLKKRANALLTRADQLERIHLTKLGDALSRLRTPQLPGVDNGDASVLLEAL